MHSEIAVLQELVDIVPGAPLRMTDRARFMHALGISGSDDDSSSIDADRRQVDAAAGEMDMANSTSKARILRSVGDAAYEMPLPPRWAEQVDVRGFVYFSHALQTEATWEHPLLDAFRDTVDFAGQLVDAQTPLEETAASVEKHLRVVQGRAAEALKEWSGPHRTPGSNDDFFHNETTNESSWQSPLEVWQYELHARYWLLVQLLQHLHGKDAASPKEEVVPTLESSTSLTTPRFAGLTRMNTDDGESQWSSSIISVAVRSHATGIASSLASSAPSFGAHAQCIVTPTPVCALGDELPRIPPPPPVRPPPPLRHLAAPPRINDALPNMALCTLSRPSSVPTRQETMQEMKSFPPPPPDCSPNRFVAPPRQPCVACLIDSDFIPPPDDDIPPPPDSPLEANGFSPPPGSPLGAKGFVLPHGMRLGSSLNGSTPLPEFPQDSFMSPCSSPPVSTRSPPGSTRERASKQVGYAAPPPRCAPASKRQEPPATVSASAVIKAAPRPLLPPATSTSVALPNESVSTQGSAWVSQPRKKHRAASTTCIIS